MRYMPGLIPEESKVLPEYFKGTPYPAPAINKAQSLLYYLGAAIFFIAAIFNINHPVLTLLFGAIGFILLPQGHRWIEEKLRFRFTAKIKSVFGAVLFITAIPFVAHYQEADKKAAYQLQIRKEKEEQEKIAAEKKEQQRKDSLNFYLQAAAGLQESSKFDEALNNISYAANFSTTESEKEELNRSRNNILALKTFSLVKKGKYKEALPQLTDFLNADRGNSQLLYNRAICYSKIGKIHEAVNDLRPLLESGNEEAQKLHEKINPLRKRIAYYVTRCCDGTTSDAKGRGACSWHGGVCNWNEPVYEEYRKYE